MTKTKDNKKINRKLLIKLGSIYALILAVINFFGYVIVVTTKLPTEKTTAVLVWESFKTNHLIFIIASMSFIFLIPFIILAFYLLNKDEESLPGRIINLPITYALVGSLGWVLPYVYELICLCYIAVKYDVHMHSIALVSLMNVVQSALFIGVFAFLSLDALHRKFVLPKYFPDGKLSKYKGTKKLSTRVLIAIFYMSVGIIPIIYLLSVLTSYSYSEGFTIEFVIYEVAFALMIIGYIMLSIFSRYFTKPLKALKEATNAIKSENYDQKVNIVSSDDFGDLADNFNDMAEELDYKTERIIAIQDSIIRGMAVMVESNDNSTGGHIARTSDCVKILTRRIKKEKYRTDIDNSFWADLIKAAPMHDLGKIAVDDSVLRKPGKFTPEEYELMKKHAEEGAKIVEKVLNEVDDEQFTNIAINVAHYHHEKWDGTGYPCGLKGDEIPLEARMMALADVFDALVSKRCYKDEMPFDQAFQIIEDSLGTHFDPELGLIFLRCRPSLENLYTSYFAKEKN